MKKILIIEDEQPIRDTLKDILNLAGFDTLSAEDGSTGIQLAREHIPDLILCDIMMPQKDGYYVLKTLQKSAITEAIPFIFLTAKADRPSIRQGMNLGADDYLTKPFTPREVLAALNSRLKKQSILTQAYIDQISDLTAQLDHQRYHDPLTDLPNRLSLERAFQAFANSGEQAATLIAFLHLSLKQLSQVSVALGLEPTQDLLQQVTRRLQGITSVYGIAYLNYHQFALMLAPVLTQEKVHHEIEKVLSIFSPPFLLSNYELFLTPQVGVALYPQDGGSLDTLLFNAEIAGTSQYFNSGKTTHFYSAELQHQVKQRFEVESDLHQALERQQLQVYYQPQFNIHTGQLIGAEALIRWLHPERGLISPNEFIPMAEETNLIVPIGRWIVTTACTQVKIWQAYHPHLRISINLSARQFAEHQLLQNILQTLDKTALAPEYLELEITESLLVRDTHLVRQILNALKQVKVSVAIDDFGVGYSSLSYLQQLPLNTLKIDRCFIDNLAKNPRNQKIVSAVIQMAHSMHLEVVAEGIEQETDLILLRQFQCDIAQGYWFSPPLSKNEFEERFLQADSAL